MKYHAIVSGIFIQRPNRFLARVLLGDEEVFAHVKNTGRLGELLRPGATVYLEPSTNPNRKTLYSLVGVLLGDQYVNIDSQAPNKILHEALLTQRPLAGFPFPRDVVRPEYTFGDSRLDFYLESEGTRYLAEVKGVSLVEKSTALFPDAPTERGIKHIFELVHAVEQGYQAIICFIIQRGDAVSFSPNYKTHPAFGEALKAAKQAGVMLTAFLCQTAPGEVTLGASIPIIL